MSFEEKKLAGIIVLKGPLFFKKAPSIERCGPFSQCNCIGSYCLGPKMPMKFVKKAHRVCWPELSLT